MTKQEAYRKKLLSLEDWDAYLLTESRLPGPRANLELAQSVADEGDAARFDRYLSYGPVEAPVNSPEEFLPVCATIGLGRLIAEGHQGHLERLRLCASDPRWRVREAVAMGLQRWGEVDMDQLIAAMWDWSRGAPLEQRAVAAGLCEPKLLAKPQHAAAVLQILDQITASIEQVEDRRSPDFKTLRKGLGYCWSVAVVALPEDGKPLMEKWLRSSDKDICWMMKSNLKKNRLVRMDAEWVEKQLKSMYVQKTGESP
jgi:hypothetical protein